MPYHVGEKGSYGCSGYPTVKDDDKTVMGCHETIVAAQNQITAINMSEAEQGKKKRLKSGLGETDPASDAESMLQLNQTEKEVVASGNGVGIKNPEEWPKVKKNSITEGDYVMGTTSEGVVHGRVEHIMWEGGTLGMPGEEYSIESLPPENPAMSVRIFEYEEDEGWEPTAYSIGMMYQDAQVIDISNHVMEDMDKSMTDSNGMPSATGQPYPASTRPSLFEEEKKTDTSDSEIVDKANPCWEGYVMVGMKPGRGGRSVPNCVPRGRAKFLTEPFI
jgi:hypothetical protein